MANKLPEFKGKPLIEVPAFIPSANFLEGDFGKAVLKEYRGRANKDYNGDSALNVLSYEGGIVRGSNPFAVVLVNQILEQSQSGLRVANQSDLELAIKNNTLPLREQYEDTSLVLRNEDEPNEYLARDLIAQIRARKPKMPAMIPLSELELVADSNSPYNLGFKLKDSTHVFYDLSVLNKDGDFSSEDIDEKTGLPIKVGSKGDRHLYIRDSGLSRLCLSRDLNAYSDYENLADSIGDGRVVIVSAKGTSQKILPYTQREVRKYSQLVQGIKDGKYPNSKLEKVLGFFEKLK